ncbi:fimbrial protein [Dyella amyloliquefaciens]|uniref:fimbrial protein n=1 Tax=Dyella amyloliquefaciens TaxID=1770545 RepID=UPI00102EC0B1|nr:fimbrial protein [Dyella amyloliquefaciens]
MKNVKLATALFALGFVAIGSAAHASSNGGTITFTGAVTDETCTVTGGAGTDGGTGNFTVALDPVAASKLPSAGSFANKKPFQVIIGGQGQGSCQDGKVATMSFLASSPRVNPNGNLDNALTGQATNTQVQVLDATGTAIALNTGTWSVNSPAIANNTATIDFGAQYFATGAATPGLVSTSVIYAVTYN